MGFLSHDTLSEHKNAKYIRDIFNLDLVARFVTSLDEFEAAFVEIQKQSDAVMIIDVGSLKDFDEDRLLDITRRHTTKPTFSFTFSPKFLESYLLICKRVPQEQGEWAANTALAILDGKSPGNIPVAMNKKAAIRLNMQMAKKLGIKFPMDLIERATFVSEDR